MEVSFSTHSETSCFCGGSISASLESASFASATIGTSTTILREMDAASISMCTIFAFFANSSILPVMRSLKRVPTEKRRSHSETAVFAAAQPCMPMLPRYSGWSVGIAPLPMTVVTTGAFTFSSTAESASPPRDTFTPPPMRRSGRFAEQSISAAFFSCPMCTPEEGL